MVDRLQEWPDILRRCEIARRQVNAMFHHYSLLYVATWEPRPCPTREEYP